MKINSISIYNLRSILKVQDLDLSNGLDILIGQNDCGKSTILYGLDVFFDTERKFNFNNSGKNDLSLSAVQQPLSVGDLLIEEDEIAVCCKFEVSPDDLNQEKSNLRNYCFDSTLTILKKSSAEARYEGKTTKKDFTYYVLKQRFNNNDFNDLDHLKEKDLKDLMGKYPESEKLLVNVNDSGKPENPERVAALIKYAQQNCEIVWVYEPFIFATKRDPIWPEFRLIDTQTALDGKNKVIDDAFKKIDLKIEQKHIATIELIKADAIQEYDQITQRVTRYAQTNYLPQLESFSARPVVTLNVARDLVMRRLGQAGESHFSQQGDGTKRRMMVAILQVSSDFISELEEQEELSATMPAIYEPLKIWAFDEPEMHLHPGAQRSLYQSFGNFKSKGFQIICSTHSTVFVNNSEIKATHFIQLNDAHVTEIVQKDSEKLSQLIKENLGVKNSDVFFSNVFVVLEGDTEIEAFPILYEAKFNRHYTHDDISIVSNGGWTKSKNDFLFLHGCLGSTTCLFDSDVSSKVAITEEEMPDVIKYIGKATFEDSFSNEVWLPILESDYDLKELYEGESIWTTEVIDSLREEIELTDANKKFPTLLERYYQDRYREITASHDYPCKFIKKELGKKLAHKSVEINKVPKSLEEFLEIVSAKI